MVLTRFHRSHRMGEETFFLFHYFPAVQIVVNSIEPEPEQEENVCRALKAELCLQRETLLYNIGEKWNTTLKWTLPTEQIRATKQPTTTSLQVGGGYMVGGCCCSPFSLVHLSLVLLPRDS